MNWANTSRDSKWVEEALPASSRSYNNSTELPINFTFYCYKPNWEWHNLSINVITFEHIIINHIHDIIIPFNYYFRTPNYKLFSSLFYQVTCFILIIVQLWSILSLIIWPILCRTWQYNNVLHSNGSWLAESSVILVRVKDSLSDLHFGASKSKTKSKASRFGVINHFGVVSAPF